jgi:tetratricopeptide (TPR) repeat protein
MKKKVLLGCLAALVLAVAAGWLWQATRGETASPRAETKALPCVRTVTVMAALIEHPRAKRVFLAGDEAQDYAACFARAGVACCTDGKAPCDIVFATGTKARLPEGLLERTLAAGGIFALAVDARELPAPRFWNLLSAFPTGDFRFWMPGDVDWLIVGRRGDEPVSLAAMMEVFTREGAFDDLAAARCDALPSLLASYVGTRADVMPAFNGSVENVRADHFVTRQTPSLAWISTRGVDADIALGALSEMRSALIVRRMVLAGNLFAARGDEKRAAETWARAAAQHPGDSLLVERLERLSVNGKVFLQLGKAAMAARCYETMAQICPDDPRPVYQYGVSVQKLGKKDLAARAFARARELEKKAKRGEAR